MEKASNIELPAVELISAVFSLQVVFVDGNGLFHYRGEATDRTKDFRFSVFTLKIT